MSHGNIIRWLRRKLDRDNRLATGSLLLDQHRRMHRAGLDKAEPPKTRLFPGL